MEQHHLFPEALRLIDPRTTIQARKDRDQGRHLDGICTAEEVAAYIVSDPQLASVHLVASNDDLPDTKDESEQGVLSCLTVL